MVDGFILNADESCENKLRHSWILSDVPHDIDYIIESVCHFHEIVNEWTSHSLVSKLVHIVRRLFVKYGQKERSDQRIWY